jgi:hypothetical protein
MRQHPSALDKKGIHMSSTTIYSEFVYPDHLISPINGYTTKRITKANINRFGFPSIEDLLHAYPDFPLACPQTQYLNRLASIEGRTKQLDRDKVKYMESPKLCAQCGDIIPYLKRTTKFCNSSCSATYNNTNGPPATEAQRSRTSNSLKSFHNSNPDFGTQVQSRISASRIRITKVTPDNCKCCSKLFYTKTGNGRKTTCSPECARINSTYRKIVIPYEHMGQTVLLESSWELAIAQWLDTNQVDWTRPAHLPWIDKKGKKRKYFPDFYLPRYDVYLDPKNAYQISISLDKLEYISGRYTLVYGQVEAIKRYLLNRISLG